MTGKVAETYISTLFIFQGIQDLLVLSLETHRKAVGQDFTSAIFFYLSHDDII